MQTLCKSNNKTRYQIDHLNYRHSNAILY